MEQDMKKKGYLDYKTWTFADLKRYLQAIKGHSKKYVYVQINALKYMAREYGLDLRAHPDVIHEQFLDYVWYRREHEDAEDALNNCQKAMKNLFDAFGVKENYPWVKIRRKKPVIEVYENDIAYKLINHTYSKDPAVNATYQHLLHYGHYAGVRPPSELFSLRVRDINWEERKVTVWQPKVRKKRYIILEPFIITSPVDKSLWNYYKNWRPKLLKRGNYKGDAFWLNANGEPLSFDYMRQQMSEKGKEVCPYFHPYLMRHWCATYRLIQSYLRTGVFDILGVNLFMDHSSLDVTYGYVHIAKKILREYENGSKVGRIRSKIRGVKR